MGQDPIVELGQVRTTCWDMEYSIHACPAKYRREVMDVFPGVETSDLLIVPTCQRSDLDLVQTGEKIDTEKDRLLERFVEWSKAVCAKLIAQGHWADYIDPCSGLPMINQNGNNVYGEVEALSVLLGFKTQNAGCCKIVLHPRWGSSVYPASMFTRAPPEVLASAIAATEQEVAGRQGA